MRFFALICGTSLLSTLAQADSALLTKTYFSGYAPVEWARPARCDVFLDRVVTERRFGDADDKGFVVREEKAVSISRGILQVVVAASAEELVSSPNDLCDGPEWSVSAGDVVLDQSGGCGNPRQERRGPYAHMLRDLIELYCPIGN